MILLTGGSAAADCPSAYTVEDLPSVLVDMTSTGVTNVFSVTGKGKIYVVLLQVTSGMVGTPTSSLEIEIDGNTRSIPLYQGGITWPSKTVGLARNLGLTAVANGNVVDDTLVLPLHASYWISARVGINVTGVAVAGDCRLTAVRGSKI